MRKSIMVDEDLHSMLSAAAKAAGVSVNEILEQHLNGMKPYREYKLKFSVDFSNRLDSICASSGLNPSEYIENNLKFIDYPPDSDNSFELPDFL